MNNVKHCEGLKQVKAYQPDCVEAGVSRELMYHGDLFVHFDICTCWICATASQNFCGESSKTVSICDLSRKRTLGVVPVEEH